MIKNTGKALLSLVIRLLVTALFCTFIVGIFDFSLFHKYFFPSTSFTTARYLFVLLVRLLTTVINLYLGLSERKQDHSFKDFYSTSASVFIGSSVISVLLYIAVGIKNESLYYYFQFVNLHVPTIRLFSNRAVAVADFFFICVIIANTVLLYGILHKLIDHLTYEKTCLHHRWKKGCTCQVCGTVRDSNHSFKGCTCQVCGATRNKEHNWDGCRCKRCGKVRNEQHNWDGCRCKRCGDTRDQDHDWDGCKCRRCGKTRYQDHDWDGCRCKRCGAEHHDWDGCKCRRCGKVRNEQHDPNEHCRCRKCGRECHDYEDFDGGYTCKKCGEIWVNYSGYY